MKLICPEYDLKLELQENSINVLVVENPKILADIVQELRRQIDGIEGRFVLSENNKMIQISKYIDLIMDVFSLNCNEKKVILKVYQEIEELANENLVKERMEINSAISCYMEKLCEQVSYQMKYQMEIFLSMLMKMVDLKFETEAVSLLEHIIEYLSIISKINPNTIHVFVNLKLFLSSEEIQDLYEYVFYNKIPVILMEGVIINSYPTEKITIIDMDKCTIKT